MHIGVVAARKAQRRVLVEMHLYAHSHLVGEG
jgi:hypothetical protein